METLACGFNHVASITRDLDRLIAFHEELLGLPFEDMTDPRARHGMFRLGPSCGLHVFEIPEEGTGPFPENEMMRRGRLDHIAFETTGEAALAEVRRRAVALGASDGTLTLFGRTSLSLHVVDPDGQHLEVCCVPDGSVFGPGDYEVHRIAG
jgi:catechol 2,3-dioxygenase-like lactoylglutathione lyase family enzyme